MKKIFTLIFIAAAMLSTTSCLEDEVLVNDSGVEYNPHFDYSAPKPVIEFMTETNASTINYDSKNNKFEGAAYVNYTIDDAKKITEDVHVTVSLDPTLVSGNILPADAYKVRIHNMTGDSYGAFPVDAVIAAYSKLPNRRPNTIEGKPEENVQLYEANRQSVALVIEVNPESGLEAGAYKLPLRITGVSGADANISGNFGYQVITVNVN